MNESGHYYNLKGEAVFEVPNKTKGGMRPTTIGDCRKLGLLPSVTTLFRVLAKPELDRWKQTQVLLASMTLPRNEGESDDSWMSRVMEDAFVQVGDAADLGTRVHAALENHFQGRPFDESLKSYVDPVDVWVKQNGVTFIEHEIRLVNSDGGYAGTTDAHIKVAGREGTGILDFKTRKSKPQYPMTPWSTEPIQIAAYGKVKSASFGVNVFISTTEPGRVECAWYEKEQMERDYEAFTHIVSLWSYMNNYDPRKLTIPPNPNK